jgi:hypothetical protein
MDFPPSPLRFKAKRGKTIAYLAVSLVFVGGGWLMIHKGEIITGWLGGGFFGLCAAFFAVQLFPKMRPILLIDEHGIEFGSQLRTNRINWKDISEFGVAIVRGHHGMVAQKLVGINFSAEYHRAAKGRAVNKFLVGYEGALPDTYGFKADELAELLNWYLQKANAKTAPEGDLTD